VSLRGPVAAVSVTHHERKMLRRYPIPGAGLIDGPHDHGDLPIRLDHFVPNLREDDLAIGPDEIKVTKLHFWADDVDVNEGLLDQLFHTLSVMLAQI
jgi:hypothetical protein